MANDLTASSITTRIGVPQQAIVMAQIVTSADASTSDTFNVSLPALGIKNLQGILGFIATTTGSVVAQEQPAVAVNSSSGLMTVTIGSGLTVANSKQRTYYVFGY